MKPKKINGHLVTYLPENNTERRWLNELADSYRKEGQREAEDRMMSFMFLFMSELSAITLHEQFGFGGKRQTQFYESLRKTLDEVANIFARDELDDIERVYSKAKMDARLRVALGNPDLPEWDERYGVKK